MVEIVLMSCECSLIGKIILGTPLKIWGIFLLLVYIGITSTRTRVVSLIRLFVIPIVLIWFNRNISFSPEGIDFFLICLSVGLVVGLVSVYKVPIKVMKNARAVELPGTWSTLIIILLIFVIKYAFGYLHATNPALASQYLFLEASLCGLIPGWFLGKSSWYLYCFSKA